MGEDPKYTIKKIVDDITVKKDDDVTDATIIFIYKGGPEAFKELASYDVVVTFDDAPERSARFNQDVPGHHPEVHPVHVLTVDKYDSSYNLICTADKMQHKMKEQMRSVIEAAAQTSTYTLRIINEEPNNRRVGGLELWETTYHVKYTDK